MTRTFEPLTDSRGRPYAEVRGYLREDLAAAAVDANVLTPESAIVAVYGLDSSDVWRHIGEATVWNYDETGDFVEGAYIRASLNSDDRFEVYWSSCAATALTVPDSPV
jgi:hypothetical protein